MLSNKLFYKRESTRYVALMLMNGIQMNKNKKKLSFVANSHTNKMKICCLPKVMNKAAKWHFFWCYKMHNAHFYVLHFHTHRQPINNRTAFWRWQYLFDTYNDPCPPPVRYWCEDTTFYAYRVYHVSLRS